MGTRLEILVPGLEESKGFSLVRNISEQLDELLRQISNYDPGSELSKLNREGYMRRTEISHWLRTLIEDGILYHRLTRGYFDFTLGGWTSNTDLIRDTGRRFADLLSTPMEERLVIEGGTVILLQEDVRIDPGGIGKGMALRIIEKILFDQEIQDAFISFGGSSVLGIGKHPHGNTWKVGIQHPDITGKVIAEVDLLDSSVSISGNSSNNRKKYGERGHILNPTEASFYNGRDIVSVVSNDPAEAEVLSTALLAAGEAHAKEVLEGFKNVIYQRYIIERID